MADEGNDSTDETWEAVRDKGEPPKRQTIIPLHEGEPPRAETADEAWTRRQTERNTIATRCYAELIRKDALRPQPKPEMPKLEDVADAKGDPLGLVLKWAEVKYEEEPIPDRKTLLADWREQYGPCHGVTESTMRVVRQKLAPGAVGGRPKNRA